MSEKLTPFSKQELLPLEERLEISATQQSLTIGIPKESEPNENRVCLSPEAVYTLTCHNHKVVIESGAGESSNYSNEEYSLAGAEITFDRAKVFGSSIVMKVNPPSLEEIGWLSEKSILISAIQLKTQSSKYFKALGNKKVTALAYEFIQDDTGAFPIVRQLSEIAGNASSLIAAEFLGNTEFGKGMLFGNICGVAPTEVVIIGAGTAGFFAAQSAIRMGASVKIFDHSPIKLRRIKSKLGHNIYTVALQQKSLKQALLNCDVAIGAVRGKNRAPILVDEDTVRQMKPGSVIIDISIDMGGNFETSEVTSHQNPIFVKHGVIHYGVTNIPSLYAQTASTAMSNLLTPYLLDIAQNGCLEQAIRFNRSLKTGLYCYHGVWTNASVCKWFDLEYKDLNLFIF